MNFSVREYKPSMLLQPFVDCYWRGKFNIKSEQTVAFDMVPNACLELIIHLDDLRCHLPGPNNWSQTPDYMLIGLFTAARQVRFPGMVPVFTIRFKPEAIFSLFNLNGSEILEKFEDISLMLDNDFRDFCHRIREEKDTETMILLTEQFLLKQLTKRKKTSDYVNKAAELMRNNDFNNIQEISAEVCISQRQLERKFRNIMGVSPKKYLRLTRINKVMHILEQNSPLDLTSVAYHCGYFDQAHFINDFKKITGKNPTVYFNEKQRFITLPAQVEIN